MVLSVCAPGPLKAGCLYQGTREEVEEHQKECPHLEVGEKHSLQVLIQEVCGYVETSSWSGCCDPNATSYFHVVPSCL